jgi:hypothetical protein
MRMTSPVRSHSLVNHSGTSVLADSVGKGMKAGLVMSHVCMDVPFLPSVQIAAYEALNELRVPATFVHGFGVVSAYNTDGLSNLVNALAGYPEQQPDLPVAQVVVYQGLCDELIANIELDTCQLGVSALPDGLQ